MTTSPTDPHRPEGAGRSTGMTRRSVLGWAAAAGAGALLLPGSLAEAGPGGPTPTPTPPPFAPGLAPFPQQEDLNFQTLFAYGESAYGAAEVGEVAATVGAIQSAIAAGGAQAIPAYQPYVTQFEALGQRMAAAADAARAAGHRVSARSKYLRAASYYNCALFFVLGSTNPEREAALYGLMQTQWAAAAALFNPAYQRILIPADVRFPNPTGSGNPVTRSVQIPAYFLRAPGPGRKPTVIVNNGSDAQLIDVFTYGGAAAVERGYNALIFEGPGQGSLLFEQNVPFTPHWEDVITPLVDFLVTQPDVDPAKLALTGWSFGGLLVFRAAAVEHRLKAVVGDPGYVDNLTPWQELITKLKSIFGEVSNQAFSELYYGSPEYGIPSQASLKYLVNKRGEFYSSDYRNTALSGKPNLDIVGLLADIGSYSADAALVAGVTANVLIATYEGDQFFDEAQAEKLRGWLTSSASATIHRFTAAEGAGYHCGPMAPQLRNEVVYDWLADIFDHGLTPRS